MEKINASLIIEKLTEGSKNTKNAPTNNLVINCILNAGLDKIGVETTRSNGGFNRGSIVECCIKKVINDYLGIGTKTENEKSVSDYDLNLTKRNKELLNELGLNNKTYEVKCISSLARASAIAPSSIAKIEDVIMVDLRAKSLGVYLVNKKDLILYDKNNSIQDYKNSKKLELLSELLLG